MSKSRQVTSRRTDGPAAARPAGLAVNRIVPIIGGAFLLFLVWQIVSAARASRQPTLAPAAPGVKPVALADIRGNIARGQPALDFTVRTMGGGKFALADHAGQPTIIMFSAAWCGSCLFEAKNLAQVYTKYKDRGLNIIILDADPGDSDADVLRFREAAGNADHVWAFDDHYTLTQAYNVRSLDTTVLIDQSGKILYEDEYPTPLGPLLQAVGAVLPEE